MTESFPILCYHKIAVRPRETQWPGTYVDPGVFRKHVRFLARKGALVTLTEALAGTRTPIAGVLTFDDGTADFLENAVPVLGEHGAKATIYIVSGEIGGTNAWDADKGDVRVPLLSAREIELLARDGSYEFGSHTHTHCDLAQLPEQGFGLEIERSAAIVTEVTGRPCETFCYPYGRKREAAIEAVRQAGYHAAVSTEKGLARRDGDRFRLPRIAVRHDTSLPILIYKLWRANRFGR